MLVLTRREGQWITLDLGDGRTVRVCVKSLEHDGIRGGKVARLVFEAPQSVKIWREELMGERKHD